MAVSIAHRVCGVGMATLGTAMFVWWLVALAGGPAPYAVFHRWVVGEPSAQGVVRAANLLALLVAIGLTLAFFTHLANGVRHFFMDIGANYELRTNRTSSYIVFAFGVTATILLWAFIFVKGV